MRTGVAQKGKKEKMQKQGVGKIDPRTLEHSWLIAKNNIYVPMLSQGLVSLLI